MTPPFRFEAVYDEGLVRRAAWTFAKRRFGSDRGLWLAAILTAACLIASIALGDAVWPVLLLLGLSILVGAFFLVVWFAHRAAALRKLRALDAMRATFVFDEAGLSVATKAGSISLVWAALDEVWAYADFWIFTTAANAYFTLPTATVPPEAMAFARERLGERMR